MTVTSTDSQDATVLRLYGRLDAVTAPRLENVCRECIKPDTRKVVLDFQDLDYISSAGVRAVLLVGKKVQADGGTLVLSGLHGSPKTVLEMSGLVSLFPVYESVDDAVQSH